MYICFAEYRIMPEQRELYLAASTKLQQETALHVHVYEGTDQPCLFVEVWTTDSKENAEQIKEERASRRSPWFELSQWIVGGPAKLNVWTFKSITTITS
ncbi:hypothetical protein [Paenibacillus sp. L3-i20]|uniref:hypothetical protein n=1 Tax=Paenibacillus sp. L3-i20 TaxID=2905833 RepID=UPI001EDDF718|nr:hypothetical protein [Paenibacillus sp. L3-i20]GKU80358.1 hypothetical protein L3i20_v247550 [Paenibacillus sp. L3-i20]